MRILLGVFILAASAWAQDLQQLQQFERALERIREARFETSGGLSPAEHSRFQWGIYSTVSLLGVDNEAGEQARQLQLSSRIWALGQIEGHTAYARMHVRYRWLNDVDTFDGHQDGWVWPLFDRYWYRFDWRADKRAEEGHDPSWNWWVQAGRQNVHWASGFTLSLDLYAARVGLEVGKFTIEGLIGATPSNTVDFDGSRPGFATDTDRRFWAALVEFDGISHHRPYFYAVGQLDKNNTALTTGVRWFYESTYVALGSVGQLSGITVYRIEVVKEIGDSISDALGGFPQTIDDIDAWAGHFQLVITPRRYRASSRLRLEFEVIVGSGDTDRQHAAHTVGGNQSGTKDKSFNAFGYARTGLVAAPGLGNLLSLRLSAGMFPFHDSTTARNLRVALDGFVFMKLDADAPLTVTTIEGESFVGVEFDLSIEWQVYSDLAFDLRYGIFIPGSAVADNDPRHFLYFAFSYGF